MSTLSGIAWLLLCVSARVTAGHVSTNATPSPHSEQDEQIKEKQRTMEQRLDSPQPTRHSPYTTVGCGSALELLRLKHDLSILKTKLEATETKLEAKLETTDTKLEAKLEATEAKLKATETKLEATETKLEATETKLEATETKLEATETKLEAMKTKLEATRTMFLSCIKSEPKHSASKCDSLCGPEYLYSKDDLYDQDVQCRRHVWTAQEATSHVNHDGFPVPRVPGAGWSVCIKAVPIRFTSITVDLNVPGNHIIVGHFDIRMNMGEYKQTVIVDEKDESLKKPWRNPESYSPVPFPFAVGLPFRLVIKAVDVYTLAFYVNNRFIAKRRVTHPVSLVRDVSVNGDVELMSINTWCTKRSATRGKRNGNESAFMG